MTLLSTVRSHAHEMRRGTWHSRLRRAATSPEAAVPLLLAILLVALFVLNPGLLGEGQFARFIGRSAPVAIVALGQFFVIVSGELDLSMGAVIAAQVVLAGNLIGEDAGRIPSVLALMLVVAVTIGALNGLIIAVLKVPSFIATLGTALAISGMTFYVTGGAPSGNPADEFRAIGRGGVEGVPLLGFVPFSVMVLAIIFVIAILLSRSAFGRMLASTGDNPRATALTGAPVGLLRVGAFVISSVSATVAAVLLIGYAGVSPVVGRGYEFIAITAVVLGGVALSGGRGRVTSVLAGAFVLQVGLSLLDFIGISSTWHPTVQGLIILIAIGTPLVTWRHPSSSRLSRARSADRGSIQQRMGEGATAERENGNDDKV